MLRVKKIIDKNTFFGYLNNPKVSKIEVKFIDNKTLVNPDVCKVYIYLSLPKGQIQKILGSCHKYSLKLELLSNESISYLTGLISQFNLGWLSSSHIKKLIEIEKKEKINLSIPKSLKKLIIEFQDIK